MSLELSFDEEKVGEGEPDTSFHESLVLPRESCVAVSAIQSVQEPQISAAILNSNIRSRAWFITVNYKDEREVQTPEMIRKLLDPYQFIAFQLEKKSCLHYHIYVYYRNPRYLAALKQLFPRARVEKVRGQHNEVMTYIHKDDTYVANRFKEGVEPIGHKPAKLTVEQAKEMTEAEIG